MLVMERMCRLLGLLAVQMVVVCANNPPHIVLLVGDDIGWNDVGWHNSAILTPNMNNLANAGVILNSSYVQAVCTPTRASFLTGRYPYHLGLQAGVIHREQAQFLTTNYSTLPEKLKQQGYQSHLYGKWHLGDCDWSYTPTYRGFESYGGIYGSGADHYTHVAGGRFDFRLNETVYHGYDGNHSTDAYTDLALQAITNHDPNIPMFLYVGYQAAHTPLQSEPEYANMYSSESSTDKQNYYGMISHMDDSIGQIHQALQDKGMMSNTVLVFLSDNGGDTSKAASNSPLRGSKGSQWEGAMRTPAFVNSPLLSATGYTQHGMMHAVDWYATFLEVAGVTNNDDIDGVSQWDMISNGGASGRTEFIYNINSLNDFYSMRYGDYKLIETFTRRGAQRITLYNIETDPTESSNLANSNPDLVSEIQARLNIYKASEYPANVPPVDPAAKPPRGEAWGPGWCTGGL